MKRILFFSLIFSILVTGYAQNLKKGAITPNILKKLKQGYAETKYHKAVEHAVQHNKINKLAYTGKNDNIDDYFKYKVKTKGITNQKQSGRCWMFASLNTIRPIIINKLNLPSFEFSTNYLYFYDLLEKSNLFLEGIIQTGKAKYDDRTVEWLFNNPVGDGGVWNLFVNLVKKYGVVPKDIMPETEQSENTRQLASVLRTKLREYGYTLKEEALKGASYNELEKEKVNMLKDIYKILVIALGEPPTEFTWRYKDADGNISEWGKYTPKSFYDKYIGLNLDDYVLIMDDPSREYYKVYEIKFDRNLYEGINWWFINLPTKDFKNAALESIKNNEAMYFSCDVGKELSRDKGILAMGNYDYASLFDTKFTMDKRARILTHQSGSTHGMALVGVDTDDKGNITKWLLENSWGRNSGHNGYLIMTDEWFDNYMFRIVINKKYLSPKILKLLDQKRTKLPPWDPMFEYDN